MGGMQADQSLTNKHQLFVETRKFPTDKEELLATGYQSEQNGGLTNACK